jgi:hypothetical protein
MREFRAKYMPGDTYDANYEAYLQKLEKWLYMEIKQPPETFEDMAKRVTEMCEWKKDYEDALKRSETEGL